MVRRTEREAFVLLRQKEGIISAYLHQSGLSDAAHTSLAWSDEPRKGVESLWISEDPERRSMKVGPHDDLRTIRILDSFFSDTLTEDDIRPPIFKRAAKGVPVQFLLANPEGSFGRARAGAIGQGPRFRSMHGLQLLARACNEARMGQRGWTSLEREINACKHEDDWEQIARLFLECAQGLNIDIRLYDMSPSGPLYFFGDLLLAGRFWVKANAAFLPWEHIMDTPIGDDLYDIMLGEFHELWNTAMPLDKLLEGEVEGQPRAGSGELRVFMSCSEKDKDIVDDIIRRFGDRKVGAYFYKSELKAGDTWSEEVRKEIHACDAVIVVLTQHTAANPNWLCAEIGAGWALGKVIAQANVSVQSNLVPGITDGIWSVNVASDKGKDELVNGVLAKLGWTPPPSVKPRRRKTGAGAGEGA